MSRITIDYDTETKICSVLLDGRTLENVRELYIDKYDDDARISIHMVDPPDNGMVKVTNIRAAKDHPNDKGILSEDGEYLFEVAGVTK